MPKIRKKRPCCICRRWFTPRPQARKTQVTCDSPKCKREKHRRQCEKWNRQNRDYFRSNYLEKKLAVHSTSQHPPPDTTPIIQNNTKKTTPSLANQLFSCDVIISNELFLILEYLIKAHIFRLNKRKKKRHDPG